jgi:hypothetical protein
MKSEDNNQLFLFFLLYAGQKGDVEKQRKALESLQKKSRNTRVLSIWVGLQSSTGLYLLFDCIENAVSLKLVFKD